MTTYKSYAECKIAHPDSEIVTTTKLHSNGPEFEFLPVKFIDGYYRSQCDLKTPNVEDGIWVICNPADYCSSMKEFFEAGFSLDVGDKFVGLSGRVYKVNLPVSFECIAIDRGYILSATALNGGCKIPAKAEQWTIYNNTMPLCELSDEQAVMLFNAWRKKLSIEYLNTRSVWCDLHHKGFLSPATAYRIKKKSERELFIEAAINHGIKSQKQNPKQIFGELFDSGKFKLVIKDGE